MNTAIVHAIYILSTVALTIWVAQTLYRNGHIFLVQAFHGDETMARAVNHLLRVGFYLINLGFVALFLRVGSRPDDLVTIIEHLGSKLGVVMLVLGLMHFFNMFNIGRMRRRAKRTEALAAEAAAQPEAVHPPTAAN